MEVGGGDAAPIKVENLGLRIPSFRQAFFQKHSADFLDQRSIASSANVLLPAHSEPLNHLQDRRSAALQIGKLLLEETHQIANGWDAFLGPAEDSLDLVGHS